MGGAPSLLSTPGRSATRSASPRAALGGSKHVARYRSVRRLQVREDAFQQLSIYFQQRTVLRFSARQISAAPRHSYAKERETHTHARTHTEESRHRHAERRERRWGCLCEALDEGESGSSGDVEKQGKLETVREGRCDHVRRHRFRVVVGFQFSSRLVDAQTPH